MFFCLLTAPVFAQKYESNYSNQRRFPSTKSDSISIYLDSAQQFATRSPMKAINFVNRAIELSVIQNDTRNEALAYLALGNIQQSLEQHTLAVENYRHCIDVLSGASEKKKVSEYKSSIYTDETTSTRYHAFAQMAFSLFQLGSLKEAESYIEKALSMDVEELSAEEIRDAKRIKAAILTGSGSPQKAIDLLNEVLSEERKAGNSKNETETLLSLGDAYLASGDDVKANEYYLEAKQIADKKSFTDFSVRANTALAAYYRQRGKFEDEISVRNDNISINQSLSNYLAVSQENFEIGNAYIDANQVQKAEGFLLQGLQNIPSPEQLNAANNSNIGGTESLMPIQYRSAQFQQGADAYKRLAEGFLKENDLQKAVEYFKTYTRLQDSVEIARKIELEQAIALSSGIGKNQQRIELLEKERLLNDRSIEILRKDQSFKSEQLINRNIIIGTLAFAMVILVVSVFFMLRNSKARRKADKLLALQSLSGQMNPHFIFNALNSVNEYISKNDERSANRYLSSFSKLMRQVMDDSRHTFIPINEEIDMLKLYLQLEHARFSDQFEYNIEIDEGLIDTEFMVPPMIIQPYLENAIWHGLRYREGKGLLKLGMKRDNGTLVIEIIDNGVGVKRSKELKTKNQKKQNSLGMQNIKTRVELMNELYHCDISIQVEEFEKNAEYPGTHVVIFVPQKSHLTEG